MRIAVFMKQVPAYSQGNMDEKTGVIIRTGLPSIVNVYDLAALETALRIKEKIGGEVVVFTMGPDKAEDVIRDAFAMGADDGYLICDRAFAGADVLATSYTLTQALKSTGNFDIILCGKQTTDGDTAQVSGAVAKWMKIPHMNWINELLEITERDIQVKCQLDGRLSVIQAAYPCLLSVEKSIFTPRMPSLKLKMASRKKEIKRITLENLSDKDENNYGLKGSATRVRKIFPPERTAKRDVVTKDGKEASQYILKILNNLDTCEEGE